MTISRPRFLFNNLIKALYSGALPEFSSSLLLLYLVYLLQLKMDAMLLFLGKLV